MTASQSAPPPPPPLSSPPRSPPSPTASFYDFSDDEELEYNTIMHSPSGRGVKLLFSKSKVYVHPTPSSKDNIPGYIALIEQKNGDSESASTSSAPGSPSIRTASYFLAWLPESSLGSSQESFVKVELSDGASPPKPTPLISLPSTTSPRPQSAGAYAFAIPLSEVYSMLIRPPYIGWWFGSLVINTRSGDSFPALFFHDDECQSTILQRKRRTRESFDPFSNEGTTFWGGDEVLRWIKRYVTVERCGADSSVFLVDPSAEDKLGFGDNSGSARTRDPITSSGAGTNAASSSTQDAGMDAVTKALKQARWSFLEKMSQVTNFTRRTAQDIADSPKVPPQVRRLMKNPEVQTIQDEFDSARVYLARWAMTIAEQSERERKQRIFTAQDVLEKVDTDVGQFELLDRDISTLSLSDQRKPVDRAEWQSFFDPQSGRLNVTVDEVKDRIFHGGLDSADGVRKEAWLFLLGVYDWDSSSDERKAIINSKRDEFVRLKGAWWQRVADGSPSSERSEWWREQKGRIEKDVHRTDRHITLFKGEDIPHPDPDSPFAETGTNVHMEQVKDMLLTYNEYNADLGYVQGMSDLLAPIYAVEQDDAVAFWGFVGFMDRMERNFLRDQSGMRTQLLTLDHLVQLMDPALYLHLQSADSTNFFFFFRMLLVWYKREFEWADILRLWEVLWTDYLSSNFHLFIALAILEKHRSAIMDHLKHFDEVLKYVNELSNTIDLNSTLIRAEILFRRFERTVEAIDKRQNFPEPNQVRRRKKSTGNAKPEGPSSASQSSQAQWPNLVGKPATWPATDDKVEERVISPELRALLSRKVDKLDKQQVLEHGGGIGG